MYLSIKIKFIIATVVSILWGIFSYIIAEQWLREVTDQFGTFIANSILFGIAIIPGIMNAFLLASLILDRRPKRKTPEIYPPISILIAAFNEEKNIHSTIESIEKQNYPGEIYAYVVNDGSTDGTAEIVKSYQQKYKWLKLVDIKENVGKATALNQALKNVKTELVITIDGDSYLYKDALKHLVERYLSDPENTAAVAGAVLVRNSRENLVTKIQEWDYFHGIAAVKRIQSLYQGTLVAQGAFSLYKTDVVRDVGGWPACVGEDIVLTWAILEKGYRVGFAEDACLFTNAPCTWPQFFKQRQRWSRGLIEAFKAHWKLLFAKRFTTMFIWWNLLFPFIDVVYTFAFIPGIIAALVFQNYIIVGLLTLLVLPLALLVNYGMYSIQNKMFKDQGLKVRNNFIGFILYALFYGLILQPASVAGYIREFFGGTEKNWGTK